MSDLPTVSGKEAIAAFERIDYAVVRISGSHHIMRREGSPNILTVPVHGRKAIKKGTLRSLIRTAGLTVEEFCKLLD